MTVLDITILAMIHQRLHSSLYIDTVRYYKSITRSVC